ncbi:hypothetical protein [Alkalicoccobacillus porphyridii]|uniref:Uncharacterized protein n=1 Tax=Alkalicoccobacillus porphyridii TaxID=2597270 RepID=A0A553ZXF1_9BACI|nr:hypothetical protein [Alkalicoccobacillus porphyridii]TSB46129.1 hypothetical protein FN960_12245 [Alkalicoccobacillus porphyridii]
MFKRLRSTVIRYSICLISFCFMVYMLFKDEPFGLDILQVGTLSSILLLIVFANVLIVALIDYAQGKSHSTSPLEEILTGAFFLVFSLILYVMNEKQLISTSLVFPFALSFVFLLKGSIRLINARRKMNLAEEE